MSKLDAAERKKLPTKVFGLPQQRKYPLDTEARGRDALSRASTNATPAQQSKIKRKVHAMYPGMRMHGLSSMAA